MNLEIIVVGRPVPRYSFRLAPFHAARWWHPPCRTSLWPWFDSMQLMHRRPQHSRTPTIVIVAVRMTSMPSTTRTTNAILLHSTNRFWYWFSCHRHLCTVRSCCSHHGHNSGIDSTSYLSFFVELNWFRNKMSRSSSSTQIHALHEFFAVYVFSWANQTHIHAHTHTHTQIMSRKYFK